MRQHALDEMNKENFSAKDVIQAIMSGEIVADQFDAKYQDTKYIIYGDALDGREMGIVAKIVEVDTVVITVFQLTIKAYE